MTVSQEDSPRGGNFVRTNFIVRDTGIGMSEEFQKKIFDSFAREDSARVQRTEGTGLGMAITKYIVDEMGGTITVSSQRDKGSCFHVTLDLEAAPDDMEGLRLPPGTCCWWTTTSSSAAPPPTPWRRSGSGPSGPSAGRRPSAWPGSGAARAGTTT